MTPEPHQNRTADCGRAVCNLWTCPNRPPNKSAIFPLHDSACDASCAGEDMQREMLDCVGEDIAGRYRSDVCMTLGALPVVDIVEIWVTAVKFFRKSHLPPKTVTPPSLSCKRNIAYSFA